MKINSENIIKDWWETHSTKARGDIAGGLVLLERLRKNFSLDINDHKTDNGDQLRGLSAENVNRILQTFGENRALLKVGGRSNRGLMKKIAPLLDAIKNSGMRELPFMSPKREHELRAMQRFLAARATEQLNAKKIAFEYNAGATSHKIISAILEVAAARQKAGDVAEYLVGAKLALRFPRLEIRNAPASAPDDQAKESGDFQIHDSVFHVSVSPNAGHYKKCEDNLNNGLRPFLLVPAGKLSAVRDYLQLNTNMESRTAVESVESFVSQNIEELSEFSGGKIGGGLVRLIETYNRRVEEVETNLSLQIEIPKALSEVK